MKIFKFRLKTISAEICLFKVNNRRLEQVLTHVDLFEKAMMKN